MGILSKARTVITHLMLQCFSVLRWLANDPKCPPGECMPGRRVLRFNADPTRTEDPVTDVYCAKCDHLLTACEVEGKHGRTILTERGQPYDDPDKVKLVECCERCREPVSSARTKAPQ